MADTLELVIITGMSGAGKTVAVQSFEDLGYFCIDNMPPTLLPTFWELVKESGKISRIALVIDLRSRDFFKEVDSLIATLDNTQLVTTRIIFLDSSDSVSQRSMDFTVGAGAFGDWTWRWRRCRKVLIISGYARFSGAGRSPRWNYRRGPSQSPNSSALDTVADREITWT